MPTMENNPQAGLPMAGEENQTEDCKPKDPGSEDYEAGKNFLVQNNYGQAANAFHNALVEFEKNDNQEGMANAYDKLGDICQAKSDFEKALGYFQNAFAICKKLDDLMSVLALREKMAICHRGLKQYDQALELYLAVMDTHESLNNPGGVVDAIVNMGETNHEKGDLGKAADAFKTAASIHANFNHPRHASQLLEKAAAIEKEMNG